MSRLRLAAVALSRACIVRSASALEGLVDCTEPVLVSQAIPAAFPAAGLLGCCEADSLGDLNFVLSDVLNVVLIVFLLLSGLGLLDVLVTGGASVGVADREYGIGGSCGTLAARSFSLSFNVSVLRVS